MNDRNSSIPPPLPSGKRMPRQKLPPMNGIAGLSAGAFVFMLLVLGLPLFIWFGCRIEPESGEIAILIRKTGNDLPSGQILALEEKQKGIQLDVLAEGRYFKNPYTWDWEIKTITDIPAHKLGVITRLYGRDLPPGKIIADENEKGILSDVLRPGKYRINPYANHVEMFDAITIRPGHVGVVTSLIGDDLLNTELPEDQRNTFLVAQGIKGVIPDVLDPGTYYLNPYMLNVVEVTLQSQRFEMSGADVITFLTLDGFTVTVEGTIEYGLQRDKAALLSHRVGDIDDIMKKVVLPRARGFSRIEGSKHPAINFIVGETRQTFQNELETHLSEKCDAWGVEIKSVLIRKIIVPDEIASINRDREIAVQDAAKFDRQIAQAQSKAELVKQEMLAVQSKEKVEADTERIRAVINAQQDQAVRVIAADREREVAKLELEAAQHQAEAIVLQATGEKDAIAAQNIARASVFQEQVQAFDNGMNFSRYRLYEKIGPRIQTVLTDDGEGLGSIFSSFLPKGKGVQP